MAGYKKGGKTPLDFLEKDIKKKGSTRIKALKEASRAGDIGSSTK